MIPINKDMTPITKVMTAINKDKSGSESGSNPSVHPCNSSMPKKIRDHSDFLNDYEDNCQFKCLDSNYHDTSPQSLMVYFIFK